MGRTTFKRKGNRYSNESTSSSSGYTYVRILGVLTVIVYCVSVQLQGSANASSADYLIFRSLLAQHQDPNEPQKEGQSATATAVASSFQNQHPGAIPCPEVEKKVFGSSSNGQNKNSPWYDPNLGLLYARQTVSDPSVWISVHNRTVDDLRWATIYERGSYYEYDVLKRFNLILGGETIEATENINLGSAKRDQHKRNNAKDSCLVLDVGANIGYYTMVSAAYGCNVVSFELIPFNMLRYCQSVRLNGFDQQVALYQKGVTKTVDTMNVRVNKQNPGASELGGSAVGGAAQSANQLTVDTITLDSFAREQGWLNNNNGNNHRNKIKLLKIDVEGGEFSVVEGGKEFFKAGLAENVLLEMRFGGFLYHIAVDMVAILFTGGYRTKEAAGQCQNPYPTETQSQNYTQNAITFVDCLRANTRAKRQEDMWFYLPENKDKITQ